MSVIGFGKIKLTSVCRPVHKVYASRGGHGGLKGLLPCCISKVKKIKSKAVVTELDEDGQRLMVGIKVSLG